MAAKGEDRTGSLAVDARPLAQHASNRPEDVLERRSPDRSGPGPRRPGVTGGRGRAPSVETLRGATASRHEVLSQVATVFGYAMVGAVVFQVGWWVVGGS